MRQLHQETANPNRLGQIEFLSLITTFWGSSHPTGPVEYVLKVGIEWGRYHFKTVNNNLLDLNRCFHFIVFSHILSQLMFHQPCGEKAAIFIHSYFHPTTILQRQRSLVTWSKFKKEWKPGFRTWQVLNVIGPLRNDHPLPVSTVLVS